MAACPLIRSAKEHHPCTTSPPHAAESSLPTGPGPAAAVGLGSTTTSRPRPNASGAGRWRRSKSSTSPTACPKATAGPPAAVLTRMSRILQIALLNWRRPLPADLALHADQVRARRGRDLCGSDQELPAGHKSPLWQPTDVPLQAGSPGGGSGAVPRCRS